MEGWLTDFIDWMTAIAPIWAYVVLFAVAYGENVVPPIPGDLLVVFGGYLVGVGRLDFTIVVLLATLGGVLGFMTMYAIGLRIGDAVLDPNRLRWLPKREIHKVRRWLLRWGYGVVAANRFLSGARSVISLTVGMAKMHAGRTTAFATLSAAAWTVLITYAGAALGENWPAVVEFLARYGQIVLALVVVFIIVQIVLAYRRRRGPDEHSEEAPPA